MSFLLFSGSDQFFFPYIKVERLKKLEQKQLKHKLLCQEVVLQVSWLAQWSIIIFLLLYIGFQSVINVIQLFFQIASLAEDAASYKESTNCTLSSMEWWEWKTLFVKGVVQPIVLSIQSSPMNDTLGNAAEAIEEVFFEPFSIPLKFLQVFFAYNIWFYDSRMAWTFLFYFVNDLGCPFYSWLR